MNPLTPAQKIICNGAALARELGISDREIAKAALGLAIGIAEEMGDPDGYIAKLMTLIAKEK